MAISSSTTLHTLHFAKFSPSPVLPWFSVPFKQRQERIGKSEMIASVSIGGSMRPLKGSGAGVLERPTIDPSEVGGFPLVEEGTDPFFFLYVIFVQFCCQH
jgi:hypothetical protein